MTTKAAAIITAGGIGRRMGSKSPKQYLRLNDTPIIIHTLKAVLKANAFAAVILVVPEDHRTATKALLADFGLDSACQVTAGGESRQDSVKAGLDTLDSSFSHVLVHDGVRPLVSPEIIKNCLQAAIDHGAAITAVPVKDTLKSAQHSTVVSTIDRSGLWRAQTPQAAETTLLLKAYEAAESSGLCATDEASLLENIDVPVTLVSGSETNIKITLPEDIAMAESLMDSGRDHHLPSLRIGHGYDAHRLVPGRDLVLGGVKIPHETGLLGHSDADVLVHALCDALLGALGHGDIGRHFPDSDPQFKGINSLILLKQVMSKAAASGARLINADITVVAQQPKLAPYLEQMQETISRLCQTPASRINIKATTTEQMGFTGRQEGIACHAVTLLQID